MAPRLRIITGKGGVGKSTVATAIAMAEAQKGRTTLLAEIHAGDRVSCMLESQPVGGHMRELLENLYVVDMNLEDSIKEYALLTMRFETIYRTVFENRFVKPLIRFIPSLTQMEMLGKIWHHQSQKENAEPKFDRIIIDAPSTGHAISMLRTPMALESVMPPGPMKEHAKSIRALLQDPTRTLINIVTIPEEMPIVELIELQEQFRNTLKIRVGTTIINQDLAPFNIQQVENWKQAEDTIKQALYKLLAPRNAREQAGKHFLELLPADILDQALRIPQLPTTEIKQSELLSLSKELGPHLERLNR